MNDDAMKFFLVGLSKLLGVGPHRVKADEKVTADPVTLALVKGNDVGEIVVTLILQVYFKDFRIVAEDVGNLADLLAKRGCHLPNPRRCLAARNLRHPDVDGLITYHI